MKTENFFDGLFDKERSWPDYSGYLCKCVQCNHDFGGPKRANICWKCKTINASEWAKLTPERQNEIMLENARIAHEFFIKHAEERKQKNEKN